MVRLHASRCILTRLVVVAVTATLGLGLLPPLDGTASAQGSLSGERQRTIPMWAGVQREEWQLTNSDGDPVRAQVVRVEPHAPVDFDLAFGQGQLAGLQTVPSMARDRPEDGVVLGINGGFWRSSPWGRPDGFTALDGRLVSEAETRGEPGVGRGAFGLRPDDSIVIGRVLPQDVTLHEPDQTSIDATGINRLGREGSVRVPPDGDDALYVITDQFGSSVTLPRDPDDEDGDDGNGDDGDEEEPRGPARWRAVDGLTTVPRGTGHAGQVGSAAEALPGETLSIPSRGALLVGYGTARGAVDGLDAETMTAETSLEANVDPAQWADVELGLSGGPHILRDGEMTEGWDLEGFGPSHHGRNPRTAVGVTAAGIKLLVTVDGRQDDSAGLSTAETVSFFRQLGAVDAVMLDGGGSSIMTQGTATVNEPSDGAPRPVANAVLVQHRETFSATQRLHGRGREHTAAAVARAGFPDGSSEAVVAAGGDFPDALAGGPLAAVLDAPLLLANPLGLSEVTRSALDDLGVDEVTVLGGESAVPDDVVDDLEEAGHRVERIAGDTRFSTAAAIADHVHGSASLLDTDRVVLASGLGFADALVSAAPAGMMEIPILLAAPERLTGATRETLEELAPDEIIVVGGTSALSDEVAREAQEATGAEITRLAGPDRFATAVAINEWADDELSGSAGGIGGGLAERLVVARGDRFPDALAGGPLGAQLEQLLMIVPPWDVRDDRDAEAYLDRRADRGLEQATLLGGSAALTPYQRWQIEQLTR